MKPVKCIYNSKYGLELLQDDKQKYKLIFVQRFDDESQALTEITETPDYEQASFLFDTLIETYREELNDKRRI